MSRSRTTSVDKESEPVSRRWSISTSATGNTAELLQATVADRRNSLKPTPIDVRLSRQMSARASIPGATLQTQTAKPASKRPSIISISQATTVVANSPESHSPARSQPKLQLRIPERPENDLHADLHWEINAKNPRNWSRRKKWLHTLIPCALAWVFMFGSSVVAPAHDVVMTEFNAASIVAVLSLSLYVLGLAFGPPLSNLGCELFGRKYVYMLCTPFYTIFVLASALVNITPGLLLCRFFAGVFCAPALHTGWGTLSDLWDTNEKILPLMLYTSFMFLGSTVGPVIGGYVAWKETRRWSQFVILFAFAVCLLPVLFMHETSRMAIMRKKKGQSARAPLSSLDTPSILSKPLRMLFTEPIVALYSLYIAHNFGVLYAIYAAFPNVLAHAEHFDPGQQGLAFLGMSFGIVFGVLAILLYNATVYRPRVLRYKFETATDEERAVKTDFRTPKSNRQSFGPSVEQMRLNELGAPDERRRSSIIQTLKRISGSGNYRNLEAQVPNLHKNIQLSVAASKYLNSVEGNSGKRIMPERILVLLNQNMEYGHLCVALEGYKLKLDRVELAKVLVDAMTEQPDTKDPSGEQATTAKMTPNQHREATAAALESGPSVTTTEITSSLDASARRKTWVPPSNVPPHEWRLWAAQPAAALIAGALFMLGWTAHKQAHWILPIIAMCFYSFGSLITYIGTTLYVLDCYGPMHSPAAIGGSTMLAAIFGCAFPLFALPMYEALHPGLATSIFAFSSIVLGLIPSLLYVFGPSLRRRQRYKVAK